MSINLRKVFPMFVLMFLSKGGLNQIMFLFLFRFFWPVGVKFKICCVSRSFERVFIFCLALLKISSFAELSDNLWLTDVGICLMMDLG